MDTINYLVKKITSLLIPAIFLLIIFDLYGQQNQRITDLIDYRPVGSYRTGSWISAIAVPESDNPDYKFTWYAAGRNGGVWKTVNNGTTFFPVFDSVEVSSIGAIAVSKSNPEIVWVGTGEAFNARSSHAGKGAFKSMDGGKTWQYMGLDDSHHIASVIIHPQNPDIMWIAAMGHLFTPNEMRGVFKSTDGGKTWIKVLYVDSNTGVIDLIINPENPDILYAASYEKYRYPWHFEAGGKNSAIYKTSDGGETWHKQTNGLPDGQLGRIGLALCYSQPSIVYAVIENLNPKNGKTIDETIGMNKLRDAYFDQMVGGEVYRSDDDGLSWRKQSDTTCNLSSKAAYSFNKIAVASDNPDIIYVTSELMKFSEDGGKTWPDCNWPPTTLSTEIFGDHRCMWIDPDDGRHMMVGSDGGLYESFDRGKTYTHHVQIPLGEIYIVETDNAYPYNIYVGLQDHEVWKGPSNSWSGLIGAEDWNLVGMWDGMYTRVDPDDYRWLYTSTQFGGLLRVDQLKGERVSIEPVAPEGNPRYRFCWTPPIELSPHNPEIIYTGGQMLFRSIDQGDHWEEISPDLTTNDSVKIAGKGHMMYCTITTIAESSQKSGLIWAGTDDGRVWMTPDYGKTWNEFTDQISQLVGNREIWVNRITTSPHKAGKAYVCKSGFRNDDFRPMVFKTDDFGKSWTMITANLPDSPVNVLIEDPKVEGLLYLGNDMGIYLSFDDGMTWQSIRNNMPTVPVKDITIQKTESELVAGTFGRGAYIADIWPLQQYFDSILSESASLFPIHPQPQRNRSERAHWGNYKQTGDNHIFSYNEPNGLALYYYLKTKQKDSVWVQICDMDHQPVDTLFIDQKPGFNLEYWDTWNQPPGTYRIRIHIDKMVREQKAVVKPAPIWPVGNLNRE